MANPEILSDPNVKKYCMFCHEALGSNNKFNIYYSYQNDDSLHMFCCETEKCNEGMKTLFPSLCLQCPRCQTEMKSPDRFVTSSLDTCPFNLITICCSLKCVQDTFKILRKVPNKAKKFGITVGKCHACEYCGKMGEKHGKCGRCKVVYYCSKECQSADWKLGHKNQCS